MKEIVYNLFLFVESDYVVAIGAVEHELPGSDNQRIAELQTAVAEDAKRTSRRPITPFPWDTYVALQRLGKSLEIFEEVFMEMNAPQDPLVVVTPIVDGTPRIDFVFESGPFDIGKLLKAEFGATAEMIDYLEHYSSDHGFDLPQLLNDDYFRAIKQLFNGQCYVSAAKLLMSCIDSIAFVEFGDVQRNFQQWLTRYVDLASIGVSEEELWEFRNSVLHMSSLASRKVRTGKVNQLILCVGPIDTLAPKSGTKRFELMDLIVVISQGISRWCQTYNDDVSKRTQFVERYDLSISDSRMLTVRARE